MLVLFYLYISVPTIDWSWWSLVDGWDELLCFRQIQTKDAAQARYHSIHVWPIQSSTEEIHGLVNQSSSPQLQLQYIALFIIFTKLKKKFKEAWKDTLVLVVKRNFANVSFEINNLPTKSVLFLWQFLCQLKTK